MPGSKQEVNKSLPFMKMVAKHAGNKYDVTKFVKI